MAGLADSLDAARVTVEGLVLLDTLRITRDRGGVHDDTFDEATGRWTRTGTVDVYEGPGKLRARDPQPVDQNEGGPVVVDRWDAKLPFTVDTVAPGDMVEVVASRDSSLVGRRYRVQAVEGSTLGVLRTLQLESVVPTVVQRVP